MQWFKGDIKITNMSAIYFQLNYENNIKAFEIIFTKTINNENLKIFIK